MAQFKVEYMGDLRTEATHLQSGTKIITDAPIDNNGKGEAFSPTDLVCSALASCMFTIMGIVANRENIDIKGMNATITKIMAASPRKIQEIQITLIKPESLILSEKHSEILKRAALTCPVALSLGEDVKQTINFNF